MSLWNIKVTVWHVANERKLRKEDKGRILIDKPTGSTMLHLWNHKEKQFGEIPDEAIELNSKGKKCVEMYRLGRDQYRYRINSVGTETFMNREGKVVPSIYESYQPFTDNDRKILIESERKKAELHNLKGKTWLEHLPVIAVYGFIIIMVVVIFLFWNNIWQPLKEQQQMNYDQQKLVTQAMKEMQNLIIVTRGGQIIPSNNEITENVTSSIVTGAG
jgi:hypothetical protein